MDWNRFWGEDPSNEDPIEEAQTAAKERAAEHVVEEYRELLGEFFPGGVLQAIPQHGPVTVATQVGDHWVGIVGANPPGSSALKWEGFWRQNVSVAWSHRTPTAARRQATIEKANKTIKSTDGLIAWLTWVHRNICKVSVEVLRSAMHPDNFFDDLTKAARAAYDLYLIGATYQNVEDILVQRLPWQQGSTNFQHAVHVFREGEKVGMVGCRKKDGAWDYAVQLDMSKVHVMFAMSPPFKSKHRVGGDLPPEDAKDRASRLYYHKVYDWIIDQSKNTGLRNN